MGELEAFKSRPVFIYAFGGGPEAFAAAKTLSQQGFSKVYVMAGGLFNIRWTASNVPNMSALHDLVEGVAEDNK
jgi:rhodanese-related sulfurtransferase